MVESESKRMAKFLTTSDAVSEIEKIINNAKSKLVLICPFVKIPDTLLQNLKVASRKTKITLVYGKTEMKREERDRLTQIDNLSLHFLENLHAKCFFNEDAMVITSFNMYESSLKNREMGVLITVKDDPECFNEAVKEANRIVTSADKDSLIRSVFSEVVKEAKSILDSAVKDDSRRTRTTRTPSRTRTTIRTNKPVYCISCGTPISHNVGPLCDKHSKQWGRNFRGHYCHACGELKPTSKANPLCPSCLQKTG